MSSAPDGLDLVIVDTETTGVTRDDRVVSLGIIRAREGNSEPGRVSGTYEFVHLIFNPQRKSHFGARRVHGYSDRVLKCQDDFEPYAEVIRSLIEPARFIVAHNVDFDLDFIEREFELTGKPLKTPPPVCTMQMLRDLGRPASLAAASSALGLGRDGDSHGAMEDAWLCGRLLWNLRDIRVPYPDKNKLPLAPTNFRGEANSTPVPAREPEAAGGSALYRPPRGRGRPNRTQAELWDAIGPLVTIMVALALADGAITREEIAAIERLTTESAKAAGLDVTANAMSKLVDAACSGAPTDREIAGALSKFACETGRRRLADALRIIVGADGMVAAGEVDAVRKIVGLI